MTIDEFWNIISVARSKSESDHDRQFAETVGILEKQSASDILSFRRIMSDYLAKSNTWELWGAAYVIAGGCSNDGFSDFRNWLISKGRDVYSAALDDPDSLAEIVSDLDDIFFEGFSRAAHRAYYNKTGEDLAAELAKTSPPKVNASKTAGARWASDTELPSRYPKLYARFGAKS